MAVGAAVGAMTSKVIGSAAAATGAVTSATGISAGQMVWAGMNTMGAVASYKNAEREGKGVPASMAIAARDFAIGEIFGWYALPIFMAPTMAKTAIALGERNAAIQSGYYASKGRLGGGFNMSEPAYTMRQRSLQAMQNNGQNLSTVFGNEARSFYRTATGF